MGKLRVVDAASCTGCLSCVTTCSQFNEGGSSLTRARIYVALDPFGGHNKISYCRQCKKAACAEACPVEAIRLTPDGYWDVDYGRCDGCRACIAACPFGAMLFDPVGAKVVKCHTCHGDPRCVAACASQVLRWVETGPRPVKT